MSQMLPAVLALLPERPCVRDDEISELDVVVELRTSQSNSEVSTSASKHGVNLCLVVDRSGSMRGEKLAAAKSSCVEIWNRLSEGDLLTVVVFDDEAQVIINPSTPRTEVERRLRAIEAGGSTNLSLGWYLGLLELQTHGGEAFANRLIMLSDGQANKGETKKSVLAKEAAKSSELGITTSTIGIGNDFQEDLLATLASESGGRFWYIQESRIEEIVKEEFSGSLSVLIEKPKVELQLPSGVRVVEELNELRKISDRYRLRPIVGNDLFCFAVRLEFDPSKFTGTEVLLKALVFDGESELMEANCPLPVVPIDTYVTSEASAMVAGIVEQFKSAKAGENMRQLVNSGDFDFMKRMLVSDVEGMRVVQDKLQAVRDAEEAAERQMRQDAELLRMADHMTSRTYLLPVADLLQYGITLSNSGVISSNAQFELDSVRRVVMKVISYQDSDMYDQQRRKGSDMDTLVEQDMLIGMLKIALQAADELVSLFPTDPILPEIRQRLDLALARHLR